MILKVAYFNKKIDKNFFIIQLCIDNPQEKLEEQLNLVNKDTNLLKDIKSFLYDKENRNTLLVLRYYNSHKQYDEMICTFMKCFSKYSKILKKISKNNLISLIEFSINDYILSNSNSIDNYLPKTFIIDYEFEFFDLLKKETIDLLEKIYQTSSNIESSRYLSRKKWKEYVDTYNECITLNNNEIIYNKITSNCFLSTIEVNKELVENLKQLKNQIDGLRQPKQNECQFDKFSRFESEFDKLQQIEFDFAMYGNCQLDHSYFSKEESNLKALMENEFYTYTIGPKNYKFDVHNQCKYLFNELKQYKYEFDELIMNKINQIDLDVFEPFKVYSYKAYIFNEEELLYTFLNILYSCESLTPIIKKCEKCGKFYVALKDNSKTCNRKNNNEKYTCRQNKINTSKQKYKDNFVHQMEKRIRDLYKSETMIDEKEKFEKEYTIKRNELPTKKYLYWLVKHYKGEKTIKKWKNKIDEYLKNANIF